jgi:hypothetical protein
MGSIFSYVFRSRIAGIWAIRRILYGIFGLDTRLSGSEMEVIISLENDSCEFCGRFCNSFVKPYKQAEKLEP